MATKKPIIISRRKIESVRERADKQQAKKDKQPRRRKASSAAARPVRGLSRFLTKEFHPIKTSDSKIGKVLGKRQTLAPGFLFNSFKELRLVTWPSKRQTISLTAAVLVFSIILSLFVLALDYGLGKLFKEVIIK